METCQVVYSENKLCFIEGGEKRLALSCTFLENVEIDQVIHLLNQFLNSKALIQVDVEEVLGCFSEMQEVFVASGAIENLVKYCDRMHNNVVLLLQIPSLHDFERINKLLDPLQKRLDADVNMIFGVVDTSEVDAQATILFMCHPCEIETSNVLGCYESLPSSKEAWWNFLLKELTELLKQDPRVLKYIEEEFENTELLGFACLDDICSQNYHSTWRKIDEMVSMFDSSRINDWSDEDNKMLSQRFMLLKEEVIRLQGDGNDHSHAAFMRTLLFDCEKPLSDEDVLKEEDFSASAFRYLSCPKIRTKQELREMEWMTCNRASTREEILRYQDRLLKLDLVHEESFYVKKDGDEQSKMPHDYETWSIFLIKELGELFKRDKRITSSESYLALNLRLLPDWLTLCRMTYHETEMLTLNILKLMEADFTANEYLEWDRERDERIMKSIMILKELVLQLQSDGKDHSYDVKMHSRPFHSDKRVFEEDRFTRKELSIRAIDLLHQNGIESRNHLKSLSEEEIQDLRKLGKVTRQEISEYWKSLQ